MLFTAFRRRATLASRAGLALLLGLLFDLMGIAPSTAADLPDQIRFVVPLAAGSSLDGRARVIAEALGRQLKQRVIVENRPGAGGTLGAQVVARAKPDGATLLFNNNSQVIAPHIYKDVGYDPLKDFAVVAGTMTSPLVLLAHPGAKLNSLKDFIAMAKAQGTGAVYASSGTGGVLHIAMELFLKEAALDLTHVSYKGDSVALTDVLAGRVPVMMSGLPVAIPQVKAGKLRALAVTGARRTSAFPDVPTIAESGYPAYVLDAWTGFFAPARTPPDVVERLHREITAAMATPMVREHMAATGAEFTPGSPADFAKFVTRESERYGKLVKLLALQPD